LQSAIRQDLNEEGAYAEAVAALERGDAQAGLGFLEPFVAARPRNYRFWHLHGLLLRALNRREEALKSLQLAVQLGPNAPRPANALARTLFEAGLPSAQAFARAVQLAPGDTQIVTGLTSALVADGDADGAIAGLAGLVVRSPHWVEGHVLLSKLRWAQGEREGFTRSFEAALDAMPQRVDLWREWLIALVHAEQFDEAKRVIAKGRAAIGEQPVFTINEAIVHAELGDTEKADTFFAPLEAMEDPTVQVRLVRHYLRSGRPEEADRIIGKWIGHPQDFMFWPYASIAWRMLGDPRWEWLEGDDRFFGVYDIADRLPPLDALVAALRKLHTLSGQPLEQSLRGGTQTDGDIFTHIDPVLVQLREAIRTTVAEHVAQLPPPQPGHPLLDQRRDSIAFSGAWSVRLQEGGFHANHVHPMGWISSALYIVLPQDLGDGDAGFLTIGEPNAPTLKLDMQPFRTVEPKPGRLALFPSYSWHGTRPFGQGERMTVAFDVARPGAMVGEARIRG
jgi:Flp pilus assembly protein TadD